MNSLKQYFDQNNLNAINKWEHYFEIYDKYFNKYIDRKVVLLEIGVYQGGSINMWKNYFGSNLTIYAIDINPDCKQFESENVKVFIGSQQDREFLKMVKSQIPKVDILIDDGGHTMQQQIVSFEELFDHIKDDGIYFIEDLHTSYWLNFGGGYLNSKSFIEYSKKLIDQLNAWHSKDKNFNITQFTKSAYSMHFYDSILVIEKKLMSNPVSRMSGNIIIPIDNFPGPGNNFSLLERVVQKIKNYFIKK